VIRDWKSHWYAEGEEYADLLHEDLKIRKHIRDTMGHAGISHIEIERFPHQVAMTIWTAKPGIIIGRKGTSVKSLRNDLKQMTDKSISIDVQEIEQPDLNAKLLAENVVSQLERRISHNRAMKRAVRAAMRAGAHRVKVACKGRLFGAEMAREQWQREGWVPLQTLRADIDYAQKEARTTYARIGVKVWVYKGEVLSGLPEAKESGKPFLASD
jgi:small subunit ribosomal protein S3